MENEEGKQSIMKTAEAEETTVEDAVENAAPEQPDPEPQVLNVTNVFTAPVRNTRPASIEPASDATHPLVRQVMEAGPLDTSNLGALLAMQREWEAGEAKKAFTRALIDMKGELPSVLARDKRVHFETRTGGPTTYTHLSLAAAVEAVTPHVCRHGFSLDFKTRSMEKNIEVTCTLTHRDGHAESCTLSAPPETSGTKNAVQAVASTVTLLERYTMLALLGIATKDHTDPEPRGEPAPTKTVDEIVEMFKSAKTAADIRSAKTASAAIKSSLSEEDRAELMINLEQAVKRVGGAK